MTFQRFATPAMEALEAIRVRRHLSHSSKGKTFIVREHSRKWTACTTTDAAERLAHKLYPKTSFNFHNIPVDMVNQFMEGLIAVRSKYPQVPLTFVSGKWLEDDVYAQTVGSKIYLNNSLQKFSNYDRYKQYFKQKRYMAQGDYGYGTLAVHEFGHVIDNHLAKALHLGFTRPPFYPTEDRKPVRDASAHLMRDYLATGRKFQAGKPSVYGSVIEHEAFAESVVWIAGRKKRAPAEPSYVSFVRGYLDRPDIREVVE
jgi:hypothetical protein